MAPGALYEQVCWGPHSPAHYQLIPTYHRIKAFVSGVSWIYTTLLPDLYISSSPATALALSVYLRLDGKPHHCHSKEHHFLCLCWLWKPATASSGGATNSGVDLNYRLCEIFLNQGFQPSNLRHVVTLQIAFLTFYSRVQQPRHRVHEDQSLLVTRHTLHSQATTGILPPLLAPIWSGKISYGRIH